MSVSPFNSRWWWEDEWFCMASGDGATYRMLMKRGSDGFLYDQEFRITREGGVTASDLRVVSLNKMRIWANRKDVAVGRHPVTAAVWQWSETKFRRTMDKV
jgi:hypothetical protein